MRSLRHRPNTGSLHVVQVHRSSLFDPLHLPPQVMGFIPQDLDDQVRNFILYSLNHFRCGLFWIVVLLKDLTTIQV